MTKKASVLVLDDDPRLVRLVRANLESVGYKVFVAMDAASALDLVEREMPDLILLDIMLPDVDGYEVCRRVREFSGVPIIMLTAKAEETDKVKGLRLGADDYLTKPFGVLELLARVAAVLRRTKATEDVQTPPVFVCGDVRVDFVRRRVAVRGQEVALTLTEYKLLSQLVSNAGRVMLHEDLLSKVWGADYRNELEYLRAYIRHLRRKIEQDPGNPTYILSRPGVGYLFANGPK